MTSAESDGIGGGKEKKSAIEKSTLGNGGWTLREKMIYTPMSTRSDGSSINSVSKSISLAENAPANRIMPLSRKNSRTCEQANLCVTHKVKNVRGPRYAM